MNYYIIIGYIHLVNYFVTHFVALIITDVGKNSNFISKLNPRENIIALSIRLLKVIITLQFCKIFTLQ